MTAFVVRVRDSDEARLAAACGADGVMLMPSSDPASDGDEERFEGVLAAVGGSLAVGRPPAGEGGAWRFAGAPAWAVGVASVPRVLDTVAVSTIAVPDTPMAVPPPVRSPVMAFETARSEAAIVTAPPASTVEPPATLAVVPLSMNCSAKAPSKAVLPFDTAPPITSV